MQIFISHSYHDSRLARRVAEGLAEAGFSPWLAEDQVFPGDNWAEAVGRALNESDAMIGIITPASASAPQVRQELGYALTNKAYEGRVIPLIVGDREDVPPNAYPWILDRYQVLQIGSESNLPDVLAEIAESLHRRSPVAA